MTLPRTFVLADPNVRRRVCAFVMDGAPNGCVVKFSEPRRSSAINAALHAKLGEIAATREWAGRQQDIETWKRLLVAAWSRATGKSLTLLPALDGHGIDIVFRRTSLMRQAEVRDLLAYIEAWDAGGAV